MYKFTNGVVVYDEETRDKYIKAGMTLVKDKKKEIKEDKNAEEYLQNKIERTSLRGTSRQSSRFNRRNK